MGIGKYSELITENYYEACEKNHTQAYINTPSYYGGGFGYYAASSYYYNSNSNLTNRATTNYSSTAGTRALESSISSKTDIAPVTKAEEKKETAPTQVSSIKVSGNTGSTCRYTVAKPKKYIYSELSKMFAVPGKKLVIRFKTEAPSAVANYLNENGWKKYNKHEWIANENYKTRDTGLQAVRNTNIQYI